jgi:hypothetical protein
MIEAYLSGQSAREIARWSDPQAGHTTISRYMSSKVAQAIANADALSGLRCKPMLQTRQLANRWTGRNRWTGNRWNGLPRKRWWRRLYCHSFGSAWRNFTAGWMALWTALSPP